MMAAAASFRMNFILYLPCRMEKSFPLYHEKFSIDILSEFYYMTLLKIGIEPLGDIEYYIFNA